MSNSLNDHIKRMLIIVLALSDLIDCQEAILGNDSTRVYDEKKQQQMINYLTFSTKIIKSHFMPQDSVNNNEITPASPKVYLHDLALDYQKNKFYIASIVFLILCTPFGFLLWLLKKFGKVCILKICHNSSKRRDSLDENNRSDSLLSGECGCIIRVHKEKNHRRLSKQPSGHDEKLNDSQHVAFINENRSKQTRYSYSKMKRISVSSANIETRQSVRESTLQRSNSVACILIALTNKGNANSTNSSRAIIIDKLESDDEDLNEYGEYNAHTSLNNLTTSLAKLEKS
jgi:hypothetical protein